MRDATENRGWQSALPYLILFCVSFALYAKTLSFEFLPSWDDYEYVTNNLYIRAFTAENLKTIFTGSFFRNYTPLQLLSYMADYQAWGLDPAGYHLTNVILHGINACLAYAVIGRIVPGRKVAFVSAMLFAVHPVNVENTAWISERKTLISALFSLLAMMSYIDYAKGRGKGAYLAAAVFFVLALLSKPVAVVLPAVLAAYDLLIGGDLRKKALALAPMFAISVAGSIVAFIAQSGGGSVGAETLNSEVLFGMVYPTMLPIFWKYVALILWPLDQSGFYDTTLYNSFFAPPVILATIAIIASWAIVLGYCSKRAKFWFLWFWLWLLPVSNIVPLPVYYADRYLYLPAIPFFVFIGWIAEQAAILSAARQKLIYGATAALFIIFYASLAFFRADVWKNELVFWTDAAKKSPNQYTTRFNLGYALDVRGRYEEAIREYEIAVSLSSERLAIDNLNRARLITGQKADRTETPPQDGLFDKARQIDGRPQGRSKNGNDANAQEQKVRDEQTP